MKKISFYSILFLVLIITSLYGYTQFVKKTMIYVVLKQRIDLNYPPKNIYAVTTFDQSLPDGKKILKGTNLIGNLVRDNGNFTIFFNKMQQLDGKNKIISGKSTIKTKQDEKAQGISARLGKTLHKQTKTNIIGAIFQSSDTYQAPISSILQRGTNLKVEIEFYK